MIEQSATALADVVLQYELEQTHFDKNGVGASSVKTIEMAYGLMIPAIAAGRIDAASIETPFSDEALAPGIRSIGNVYDAIAPQWVVGPFYATDSYVKAHPDIVKKYAAAINEAARVGQPQSGRSVEDPR
jgi:ABC-type nitrate/sulfonate/bicarbonate transport system substrate-binding protein